MDIMQFITGSGLLVMAAAYVLCAVIKKIPNVPDWIIPICAVVLGMALGAAIIGVNAESIVKGGLAGWAATGLNQTFKQAVAAVKKEGE